MPVDSWKCIQPSVHRHLLSISVQPVRLPLYLFFCILERKTQKESSREIGIVKTSLLVLEDSPCYSGCLRNNTHQLWHLSHFSLCHAFPSHP